jgi:hypothetical protein
VSTCVRVSASPPPCLNGKTTVVMTTPAAAIPMSVFQCKAASFRSFEIHGRAMRTGL